MSYEQNVTAEINRTILIEVLDAAEVGFKFQLEDAHAKIEAEIENVMATKKTFWTKRLYNRDEAINYLWKGYSWKDYREKVREKVRVIDNIARAKELREILQSSKLSHIRLTERDLSMLRKYL